MNDNAFVDTNIFVYARDQSEPVKQEIAESLLQHLWTKQTGKLSVQVLNEYYVNVTQKLKPGLTREEAWQDVEDLMSWDPVPLDKRMLQRGKSFQSQYSLSWWDSLILSAAESSFCPVVYSEDLAHEECYFGIQVIDPFR